LPSDGVVAVDGFFPLGWFAIEGVDYTKIGENISAAKYFNILG
jgi:hypothetical protein